MKEVTVQELKKLVDDKADIQIIDVREEYEYEQANMGAEHIPMGNILAESDKISRSKQVIIHCRSGARSASVINALEKQFGFENLYNLKGGIIAWATEIDNTLQP